MQVYTPPIPEVYVQKLIDKGFGPPPFKEPFMSTSNYGAKCFLKGYEAGKEESKKKYKKKIKLLKQELKNIREAYGTEKRGKNEN